MALNKFFLAFLVRFLWFLRFLQILELWVTVYCKSNNVNISFVGIFFEVLREREGCERKYFLCSITKRLQRGSPTAL
jgi:hypothetical protein